MPAPVRAYTSKAEAAAPEVFSPPRREGDGEGDVDAGDVDATDVPFAGWEEQPPRSAVASTVPATARLRRVSGRGAGRPGVINRCQPFVRAPSSADAVTGASPR